MEFIYFLMLNMIFLSLTMKVFTYVDLNLLIANLYVPFQCSKCDFKTNYGNILNSYFLQISYDFCMRFILIYTKEELCRCKNVINSIFSEQEMPLQCSKYDFIKIWCNILNKCFTSTNYIVNLWHTSELIVQSIHIGEKPFNYKRCKSHLSSTGMPFQCSECDISFNCYISIHAAENLNIMILGIMVFRPLKRHRLQL